MTKKCPKCGEPLEITEVDVDQDRQGNYLRALVARCPNGKCDAMYEEVIREQGSAGECLHINLERDEIDRWWCIDCGAYCGERLPF